MWQQPIELISRQFSPPSQHSGSFFLRDDGDTCTKHVGGYEIGASACGWRRTWHCLMQRHLSYGMPWANIFLRHCVAHQRLKGQVQDQDQRWYPSEETALPSDPYAATQWISSALGFSRLQRLSLEGSKCWPGVHTWYPQVWYKMLPLQLKAVCFTTI